MLGIKPSPTSRINRGIGDWIKLFATLGAVVALALPAAGAEAGAPLRLVQTVALAGVEGRIDQFPVDLPRERLSVCALGNNSVEVIDLRKGERVHSITGLGSPQGAAYLPDSHRLIVANDRG